jgi:translation initiation factor 6 (eIF-6)
MMPLAMVAVASVISCIPSRALSQLLLVDVAKGTIPRGADFYSQGMHAKSKSRVYFEKD